MDECKPLVGGRRGQQAVDVHVDFDDDDPGRGLHSSTFQLNLSLFCH